MLTGQLCNNVTRIVDLDKLPPASKEDPSLASAVIILQIDNKNTSSPKETKKQPSDEWHNSISISNGYAAYRYDFLHMLGPFESMSDGHLGHTTTAPTEFNCIRRQLGQYTPSHIGMSRKQEIMRKTR